MEAKHTPGPWLAGKYGSKQLVFCGSGEKIISQCFYPQEYETPERDANAILIAAAPELLEALEALLKEWESKERADGREWGQREVVMARSAIAKAKGKA